MAEVRKDIEHIKDGIDKIEKTSETRDKKFDEFILHDCENIKFIMEKLDFKVDIADILMVHPIKFKGFLAQDISKDPTNNGKPREEGVVDIYGNPVSRDWE